MRCSRRSEDKLESYSKRTDEKMYNFIPTISNLVGTQLRGMNSTIEKMKEEGEERYKQVNEIIVKMEKKLSMKDEANEIKADDSSKVHEDQNHGRAVATGFHGDTSEQEIERLLRETIMQGPNVLQNLSLMPSSILRTTMRGTSMSDQRICCGKS